MNKNTRKNNLKDNFKNSKKKKLTNWQCFQKRFIPELEGERSSRNKKAAIMWNTKDKEQKELYNCQNENSEFINLDKNLKEQDELYKIIGKINEALNYKTTISQINYTSSFINYELLRELIKESDNIINQKKYQNLDIFPSFIFYINQVKKKIKEKEEKNDQSASDLENELENIDIDSEKLENFIKQSENNNIEGNNNEIIQEAIIRKIELDQINESYNLAKNYKNMSEEDFLNNFKLIQERIIYFNTIDSEINYSKPFLKLMELYNKMCIYKSNFIVPFDNKNIITHNFKINKI